MSTLFAETTFAVDMGLRLRRARLAQTLTLRSLADSVGISPSLISLVETGKVLPSLATLMALARRLDCSIDELMGLGGDDPRTASAALPSLPDGFAPLIERVLQPSESITSRGDLSGPVEVEHGVVIEGEVVLTLDHERWGVAAGDSFWFDGGQPHQIANESARAARLIWFARGEQAEHCPVSSTAR